MGLKSELDCFEPVGRVIFKMADDENLTLTSYLILSYARFP